MTTFPKDVLIKPSKPNNSETISSFLMEFPRMNELPIECLSRVFRFFSFEELLNLSCVCKKWQQYCWMFQETIKFSVTTRQKLRDPHIKYLAKCFELKTITLHGAKHLTDEALKIIGHLPTLIKLNLSFCSGITDQGIKHLGTLANIRILLLSYCQQLTNKCFQHLIVLKTLQELDLSGCGRINDENLVCLCQLPQLIRLDLSFNRITREGIDVIYPRFHSDVLKYTIVLLQDLALPEQTGYTKMEMGMHTGMGMGMEMGIMNARMGMNTGMGMHNGMGMNTGMNNGMNRRMEMGTNTGINRGHWMSDTGYHDVDSDDD